jgi:hypothetical protein
VIFERANVSHTKLLSENEFFSVLKSPTLNLSIEEAAAQRIWATAGEGMSIDHFAPVLRTMMIQAYQGLGPDGEWLQIGFSGEKENARPLYFSRKTGVITVTTPASFVPISDLFPEGAAETTQQFEYLASKADGTVCTLVCVRESPAGAPLSLSSPPPSGPHDICGRLRSAGLLGL